MDSSFVDHPEVKEQTRNQNILKSTSSSLIAIYSFGMWHGSSTQKANNPSR